MRGRDKIDAVRALRNEAFHDLAQMCRRNDLAKILVADAPVLAEHAAQIAARKEDAARAVFPAEDGLFPEVQHGARDD